MAPDHSPNDAAREDERTGPSHQSHKPPLGLGPMSMWIWRRKVLWLVVVTLLFVAVDQATKVWAQANLAEPLPVKERVLEDGQLVEKTTTKFVPTRKPVVVIPGAFNLRYAENPAAAFSLTRSFPDWVRMPFLISFSVLAMVIVGVWYFRMRRPDGLLLGALSFIVAGAIGNFIDRVRLGYVIDFIDWHAGFINPSWPPWPTFNIADSCIVVGALTVVYRTLRPLYLDEAGEPAESDETAQAPAA